jgi:hypothetical protein
MSDGYTDRRGNGNGTGHAGDDLDRDASLSAGYDFFAAPSQHKWVTALQPGHPTPSAGVFHEKMIDFVLGDGVMTRCFSDVNDDNIGIQFVEQSPRSQAIDHNNISLGQEQAASGRDQTRIAGSATDQRDRAARCRSAGPDWQGTGLHSRLDSISQAYRPARITTTADRDEDIANPGNGGGPRGRIIGIVSANTPHSMARSGLGDRSINVFIPGGGVN